MLRTTLTIGLALTLIFSAPILAAAQEEEAEESPLSLEITLDTASDYMFRGQNLYDGTSLQPQSTLAYSLGELGEAHAGVWSHFSAEGGRGASEKFTEVDFDLGYEISFDILTLGAGNYWYLYPDQDDKDLADTAEFYLTASLDTLMTPTFSYYHDYRLYDYNIFELGFSHKIETDSLGEGFNMTPAVVFSWGSNADQAYDRESGLLYVETGVSFDVPLGVFTIVPSFNYNFKVDDTTENEFWFKVGLTYAL